MAAAPELVAESAESADRSPRCAPQSCLGAASSPARRARAASKTVKKMTAPGTVDSRRGARPRAKPAGPAVRKMCAAAARALCPPGPRLAATRTQSNGCDSTVATAPAAAARRAAARASRAAGVAWGASLPRRSSRLRRCSYTTNSAASYSTWRSTAARDGAARQRPRATCGDGSAANSVLQQTHRMAQRQPTGPQLRRVT